MKPVAAMPSSRKGFEAGGHPSTFLTDRLGAPVGTLALLPQVVDAVRVPVIAAGGITDARAIGAAFVRGLGSPDGHCLSFLYPGSSGKSRAPRCPF